MKQVLVPIAFMVMVAFMTVGRPIARAWARRIEGGPQDRTPALPPDTTQRLERMEQAIEAIAVEVERLAEGQRFTTKLLAERPGAASSIAASSIAAPSPAAQSMKPVEERQHASS